MQRELIEYFLPSELLKHFTIKSVIEKEDPQTKELNIEIELEELNQIPTGYESQDYESKGFYPPKKVQDFPIRGKAVYLFIKRRRWRHKVNKDEIITNDYTLIADGSKLTQELSDFLKGTGRDPRRYS